MKSMAILTFLALTSASNLMDFGKKGNVKNWNIVNDGVMGGLSQSKAKIYKDLLY